MSGLIRDFRYSLRALRRSPLTSLVIIAVLAVGIASNVAMFSGLEAWVLRPLDFRDPDHLISIFQTQPTLGQSQLGVSEPTTLDLQREARSLADVGAYRRVRLNLFGDESPRLVHATEWTPNLLPLLGVTPALGRNFTAEEAQPGQASGVALISHNVWQENFAGDTGILERELKIDGAPHQIVGIMPEGFAFPEWAEVWVPLSLDSAANRSSRSLNLIGRLVEGSSLAEASQELARISTDLEGRYPNRMQSFQLQAMGLRESFVPPVINTAIVASMAASLFVLLIICSNVASLLMAQSTTRTGELALLSALGAKRSALARRMIFEPILLALAGGVVGVLLGLWSLEWMIGSVPVRPPYLFAFRFDARAVAFTVALSLITGLVCGLAPIWRNTGVNLIEALKGGVGRTSSSRGGRVRKLLVSGQFATSLLLMLGAILMVRSYLNQQQVDPGYQTEGLVVSDVSLNGEAYTNPNSRVDFAERALSALSRIAGVTSVGLADYLPFSNRGSAAFQIEAEGFPRQLGEEEFVTRHAVSAEYLSTLGVPLLAGRHFSVAEAREGGDVVLISQGIAARLWPEEQALGKRVRIGDDSTNWLTVIGITDNLNPGHRMVSFGRIPEVQAYLPFGSVSARSMALVLRSERSLANLAPQIRETMRNLNSALPVPEVLSMTQVIELGQWVLGYFTRVLTLQAFLALLISAFGTYGIACDAVAQRRREMAIRKALGARRQDVYRLIIQEGAVLALSGIVIGCGLGYLLVQLMAGMFYGVNARDPWVFVSAASLMAMVSVLASLLPARKANQVDILDSLRSSG